MSHSLPYLTLTTSTSSLTYTSLIIPTFSPSHPSPLAHDPYLSCGDSRKSGGSTQIPSLTENKDTFFKTKTVTAAISWTRISHEEREVIVDSCASSPTVFGKRKKQFGIRRSLVRLLERMEQSQRQKKLTVHAKDLDMSITAQWLDCRWIFSKNIGITANGSKNNYPHKPLMANLFIARRKIVHRRLYLELLSTQVPEAMPMQHRETNRRQLGKTDSKMFRTGFRHSL